MPARCHRPDGLCVESPIPRAVFPGSFNPLHAGHRELAAVASRRLGVDVHFELSVTNADKPELPETEIARRVSQFAGYAPIWITRAAAFEKKADHFPGATFVLGWDTAIRLVDPKYYGSERGRDACLAKLLDRGCTMLVGGRVDSVGAFRTWDEGVVAAEFAPLFAALTESDFRVDLSSTLLRTESA